MDSFSSDWKTWYSSRTTSAVEAANFVQRGDHIWFSLGQQINVALIGLLSRLDELAPLDVCGAPVADFSWFDDETAMRMQFNIPFASPYSRDALDSQRADFLPWWVWGGHKALDEGRPGARPIDVALIAISPPNEHGYVCFGSLLWDAKTTASRAKKTIAVINPNIPKTFGDTWIHCTEIDHFILEDEPPLARSLVFPPLDPWDEPIARNVASLLHDGDTIQIGTGSTTGAIPRLGVLDQLHDLGYFAELTVPGTIDLVRKGVINSRRMTTHPGKFVTTMAGNSPEDVAFIDGNPMFEFYPVDYIHHPCAIAKNANMVAINNALSVDLTGQIAAGSLGNRIWSGTGGQLSYALGATLSPGGRSIVVLPATAVGGTISRITAQFPAGQTVTVPRDLADIIVTEYGIAHLLNKPLRERAAELISIAHPDFRAELRREASTLFGLR